MKTDDRFSVYLARIDYLETGQQKLRPVIAVSKPYGKHDVVIVIPVSSQLIQSEVDVCINDWQHSGLLKPSVARVHRLTSILRADLIEKIGEMSQKDQTALLESLKQLLELK